MHATNAGKSFSCYVRLYVRKNVQIVFDNSERSCYRIVVMLNAMHDRFISRSSKKSGDREKAEVRLEKCHRSNEVCRTADPDREDYRRSMIIMRQ